jgi:hypothetical protein
MLSRPFFGWLLAACAAVALVAGWVEYFAPLTHEVFGVRLAPQGDEAVVTAVLPTAKTSLRAEDVVLLSQMPMGSRVRLRMGFSPAGTVLSVPVRRGNAMITASVASRSRPLIGGTVATFTYLAIESTFTLLILGVIAWRRPSVATAALLFFGVGSLTSGRLVGLASILPDGPFCVAFVVLELISYAPIFALIPFVTRFPSAPDTPARLLRMRVGDAIFVAIALFSIFQAIYEPLLSDSWTIVDNLTNFASVVVLGFAVVAYIDSSGEARRRIGWVIVGIVVSVVTTTVFNIVDETISVAAQPYVFAVISALSCALPIAVAYAVLRHRVIDLGFAFNRTLVYGVIVALVIALVSLIDWLTAKVIDEQRLAAAIEALLTIAIGFALTFIHRGVEKVVDYVVFRKRHVAEKRIEYRIDALDFSESEKAVDEALSRDAAEILELASAAIFRRGAVDMPFERKGAEGWPADSLAAFDSDALLVRSLRALERPFFLDDAAIGLIGVPAGAQRPALAIPVVAQHALVGFALYGSHRDGTSPDPDETALLLRLARAAGAAYAGVEARRWRERVAALEQSLGSVAPPEALKQV